jgi:flagellar biosynthesis protein FlhG
MADSKLSENSQPTEPIIWAIGGGKGGVGKTFVSTSLAISLAKTNRPVTIVDLDLGGANVHTHLGCPPPQKTLSDYLSGRVHSLEELAVTTSIPGLRIISGSADALAIANISRSQFRKLRDDAKKLSTPYVILDLGAGTAEHTLEFFLSADKQIVAITPEPTSIENAYRFIKAAFFLHLRNLETDADVRRLVRSAMGHKNEFGIRSPADLIQHISKINPSVGMRVMEATAKFQINLILNQIRTRGDIELGQSVKSVCRKYFGIEVNFVGHVNHDNAVWQALRNRRLVAIENPYSEIVGQFLAITRGLVKSSGEKSAA